MCLPNELGLTVLRAVRSDVWLSSDAVDEDDVGCNRAGGGLQFVAKEWHQFCLRNYRESRSKRGFVDVDGQRSSIITQAQCVLCCVQDDNTPLLKTAGVAS